MKTETYLSEAATIRSYIGETYFSMDKGSLALDYQKEALQYFIEFNERENSRYVYMT